MAELFKGAPVAAALTEQLAARATALRGKGVEPTLAILRVGERPEDLSYETGAEKRCAKVGITVKKFLLAADCGREDVLAAVREINEDPAIHGCLIFRPLPDKETERAVCRLLDPAKDVDGITAGALGGVFTGDPSGFAPCTAQACLEICKYYQVPLKGKRAVVLGRSAVIGRPVAMLLLQQDATVTICHSRTENLPALCREADVLVAAVGRAKMVNAEYVKAGQILLDVGINTDAEGKLCGDADPAVAETVSAYTPVPGGVGAVTTAVLASHVIEAAERV